MNSKKLILPPPSFFVQENYSNMPELVHNFRAYAQTQYELYASLDQNYSALNMRTPNAKKLLWDTFCYQDFSTIAPSYSENTSGLFVSDLYSFALQHPALAAQYMRCATAYTQQTMLVNVVDAYWQRSLVLVVPENIAVESPIVIDRLMQSEQLVVEKVVIIVGQKSSVTVDDRLASGSGKRYATLRSIDCFVGAGATLNFIQEQDHDAASIELAHMRLYCQEKSNVSVSLFSTGGLINKQSIDLLLKGKESTAHITGATVLNGKKEHELTVRQEHLAPGSTSRVRIKNLVADAAYSVYNGTIFVGSEAENTKAAQHTQTLVLSDNAHAWAQPELEVLTNEVQCAHGSAVGQLDQMHLFYLQSRGLSLVQAQRLLIESFIADTLNISANKSRRDYLLNKTVDAIFPEEVHV